jgi:hypothetical protein
MFSRRQDVGLVYPFLVTQFAWVIGSVYHSSRKICEKLPVTVLLLGTQRGLI